MIYIIISTIALLIGALWLIPSIILHSVLIVFGVFYLGFVHKLIIDFIKIQIEDNKLKNTNIKTLGTNQDSLVTSIELLNRKVTKSLKNVSYENRRTPNYRNKKEARTFRPPDPDSENEGR